MSYPQKLCLALVLFAAFLMSCTSCSGIGTNLSRSPMEMHNATVRIETTCGEDVSWGSGVIVSRDRVVTANHVVQCTPLPGLPIFMPPTKITIDAGDGVKREAMIDVQIGDGAKDIARLLLAESTFGDEFYTPVTIGETPQLGDTVCQTSSVPRWTYRCGPVQTTDGYIRVEMRTEHGNSGAGLYNNRGQLVGIIVQLWVCEGNEFCGGRAAPIQDYRWLVP